MSNANSSNDSRKICDLCNENPSKYCCPRCEAVYCSLNCYKSEKHSECSESFYRDCVTEELKSHHVDDDSKLKMIEILQRMQNGDENPEEMEQLLESLEEPADSDDDEEVDLEERIKGLNLDDSDAVWNVLTEDEKNEFEALINQGDVGSIMPQWDPWWIYKKTKKLVEDVDIKDNTEVEALKKCPELLKVPKLTSLTKVEPNPSIKFNISNIIASYAFLLRYFNGELDPLVAYVYLLSICSNLDNNTNFEDVAIAVESVSQRCLQSVLIQIDKVSINVMKEDTYHILQGPSEEDNSLYCKCVMSHIHRLLSEAKSALKTHRNDKITKETREFSKKFPEHGREHLPNLDLSKIKRCLKKVEYYLSYLESCDMKFYI